MKEAKLKKALNKAAEKLRKISVKLENYTVKIEESGLDWTPSQVSKYERLCNKHKKALDGWDKAHVDLTQYYKNPDGHSSD